MRQMHLFERFDTHRPRPQLHVMRGELRSRGSQEMTFRKPSCDEVAEYCMERGNSIDPEEFWDFYESKGWMIGKNKMKDWKASVRTWERRQRSSKQADALDSFLNRKD